jgi:hypothetical protein
MPTPGESESKEDFVSRCIPEVMDEGASQDEAQGKCYGIWDSSKKSLDLIEVYWLVEEAWWYQYGQEEPYSYIHQVFQFYVIVVVAGKYVQVPYAVEGQEVSFDLEKAVLVEHEWVPTTRRLIKSPIRAADDGLYKCYAVLFGTPFKRDLYGTYFTAETEYCLDWYKTLPWLYHHTHNRHLGVRKIGDWVESGMDNVGVFLKGELTLKGEYEEAVDYLLNDEKVLFPSSGTLGYAASPPEEDGYIRLWPIAECSSTVAPAEFRQQPISKKAFEAMRALRR